MTAPAMTGGGSIPDVGTDNLLTAPAPKGPIGKIGKKGFAVSKTKEAKKHGHIFDKKK